MPPARRSGGHHSAGHRPLVPRGRDLRRLHGAPLRQRRRSRGHRLDGTGLYFYNARYYDPSIGRFVSADMIVPSMTNPQHLNRYSYVRNNPTNFIDPTGHCESCFIGELQNPGATLQSINAAAAALLQSSQSTFPVLPAGSNGPVGNAIRSATAAAVNTFQAAPGTIAQGVQSGLAALAQTAPGDFALQRAAQAVVSSARNDATNLGTIPSMPEIKQVIQVSETSPTGIVLSTVFRHPIVTLEQTVITTMNITNPADFTKEVAAHEYAHAIQQKMLGADFYGGYVAEQLRVGYQNNPFEVFARQFAVGYAARVPDHFLVSVLDDQR